eukprot:SAG22_NODE_4215_length_1341_cov_1.264090_1_plen_36_part_10
MVVGGGARRQASAARPSLAPRALLSVHEAGRRLELP